MQAWQCAHADVLQPLHRAMNCKPGCCTCKLARGRCVSRVRVTQQANARIRGAHWENSTARPSGIGVGSSSLLIWSITSDMRPAASRTRWLRASAAATAVATAAADFSSSSLSRVSPADASAAVAAPLATESICFPPSCHRSCWHQTASPPCCVVFSSCQNLADRFGRYLLGNLHPDAA